MLTSGATTLRVLAWEIRKPIALVLVIVIGVEISHRYQDLRQQLGDTDVPRPLRPECGVLM